MNHVSMLLSDDIIIVFTFYLQLMAFLIKQWYSVANVAALIAIKLNLQNMLLMCLYEGCKCSRTVTCGLWWAGVTSWAAQRSWRRRIAPSCPGRSPSAPDGPSWARRPPASPRSRQPSPGCRWCWTSASCTGRGQGSHKGIRRGHRGQRVHRFTTSSNWY